MADRRRVLLLLLLRRRRRARLTKRTWMRKIKIERSERGEYHALIQEMGLSDQVTSGLKYLKTHLLATKDDSVCPVHEVNSVKEMLDRCHDSTFQANALDEHGHTPLHLLVKRTFVKGKEKLKVELIVTLLTYSRAQVDYPDNAGNTPLHSAVQIEDFGTVKCLLVFNADINALNLQNKTPLDLLEESPPSLAAAVGESTKQNPDAMALGDSEQSTRQQIKDFLRTCGAQQGEELKELLRPTPAKPTVGDSTDPVDDQGSFSDQLVLAFGDIKARLDRILDQDGSSNQTGEEDQASLKYVRMLSLELKQLCKGGFRVLCMDGGGIRGLIQMELLSQLERLTGKRVTELFDWIIGTSTGGVVALGLVYAKKTVHELRQFYFKTREEVFGKGVHGIAYDTDALIKILTTEFEGYFLTDVNYPKILVTAVDKSTANPKLRFFNNCFNDEYSTQEVWKVARYTCAGPTMFKEADNYVDGGVLSQNPSTVGIIKIQDFYWQKNNMIAPISVVVSIGTGITPEDELGNIDIQDFLSFGSEKFKLKEGPGTKAGNLTTLLGNAIVESETANQTCKTLCSIVNTPFFRFNPKLSKAIPTGETDLDNLMAMLINTKTTVASAASLDSLVRLLQESVTAQANVLKRIASGDMPRRVV